MAGRSPVQLPPLCGLGLEQLEHTGLLGHGQPGPLRTPLTVRPRAAGITVRHAGELDGSLAAALHAAGPVVVDVHSDPRADASTAGRNAEPLRGGAAGGSR